MIGSPIATSEPKVIRRTTMAASTPMAVVNPNAGCWAVSIACPPSST